MSNVPSNQIDYIVSAFDATIDWAKLDAKADRNLLGVVRSVYGGAAKTISVVVCTPLDQSTRFIPQTFLNDLYAAINTVPLVGGGDTDTVPRLPNSGDAPSWEWPAEWPLIDTPVGLRWDELLGAAPFASVVQTSSDHHLNSRVAHLYLRVRRQFTLPTSPS